MKGDTIWQIMEEIGADGIELILPDEDDNLDSKYFFAYRSIYKRRIEQIKRLQLYWMDTMVLEENEWKD